MYEVAALWAVVVVFLVCRRIISCCRHINDEYGHRSPILGSSSRNVSYTQGSYAPVNSTAPTLPSYGGWHDHSRPFQASSSHKIPDTRGSYAPVKSTPTTLPSYNAWHGHSRPLQASSTYNIPDTRGVYVPTKSTVKTVTIPERGRNVSSTRRIPPPREGPSSITVLSKVLLSEDSENVTIEEGLREKARRMKREGEEARSLAKQARKRRDFTAEAKHKQVARVRESAMESLNKEAATAIFNQKNRVLWPIA